MKASRRILAGILLGWGMRDARAEPPRVPFSGVYGATAGAGSTVGWDRAGGENPAVKGPPGWGLSAAGYTPFGVDGLRVTEAIAQWDRTRWGMTASYRGLFADGGEGGAASVIGFRSALKLRDGWTAGVSGEYRILPEGGGPGGGAGLVWKPRAWGSLGAFWSRDFSRAGESRAGLGADAGSRFGGGMAWRLCGEAFFAPVGGWENRFGAGLQLHALLSVYAGWDPARETAALGVRFGMGGWEGFSAMRRHAALGGESVQGIRWRRESPP